MSLSENPSDFQRMFVDAVRHQQAGRLDSAESLYRKILSIEPRHADSLHFLGVIVNRRGQHALALDLITQAIAVNNRSAPYHASLANVLQALGRQEEAIDSYRRAIERKPDYTGAYNNMGNSFQALKRWEDAIACYRKVLVLNPHHAEACNNLASALQNQGKSDEAIAFYQRAISLKPNYAEACNNLGNVLQNQGKNDEAITFYQRAISLKPDYAAAYNNLGNALRNQEKLIETIACYDKAVSFHLPYFDNPLVNKAILLMEIGQMAEARETIQQALRVNPHSANAWFTQSQIKTFVANDPDIQTMETLLAHPETSSAADRLLLEFALGKACLEGDDPDRAFTHFAEGNRLKRSTLDYDHEATIHQIDNIAEAFTSERMREFAGQGYPSDVPVFVVGMPRSGTSLVEQILASHPEIHGAGEISVLPDIVDPLPKGALGIFDQPSALLAELGQRYANQITFPGKRRVVDKLTTNFLYAGLIHIILPNARIIHCRRDARDTCLSCYTKKFRGDRLNFTYDLKELGQFYGHYDALMAVWRERLPPDCFTEVIYENLVNDLEGEAQRLIAFCGLDWNEACLTFYQTRRQVRTASLSQVRQPIYQDSIGRWKRYERHLRPLLEALRTE